MQMPMMSTADPEPSTLDGLQEAAAGGPGADDDFKAWLDEQTGGPGAPAPAVAPGAPPAPGGEPKFFEPANHAAADAARQMDNKRFRDELEAAAAAGAGDDDDGGFSFGRLMRAIGTGFGDSGHNYSKQYTDNKRATQARDDRMAREKLARQDAEDLEGRKQAVASRRAQDEADLRRAQQDSNSAESKQTQRMTHMASGIPLDELSELTAWDWEVSGGDITKMIADKRGRETKATASLNALQAKQAAQRERDIFTGNTAEDHLRNARAQGGRAIAAEDRRTKAQIDAEDRRVAQQIKAEGRKHSREDVKIDQKKLEDYKKALAADGLVGTPAALNRLADAASAGKSVHGDVPGIGAAGAIDWLPGSTLQGFAESKLSDEGLAVRNAQKGFHEAFARGQSGAAIGIMEDERFKVLTGQVPLQSERQFYSALEWMKGWMEDRRTVHAGAYPGAAEALERNIDVERARKQGGGQAAAPKPQEAPAVDDIPADDDPGWGQ